MIKATKRRNRNEMLKFAVVPKNYLLLPSGSCFNMEKSQPHKKWYKKHCNNKPCNSKDLPDLWNTETFFLEFVVLRMVVDDGRDLL